MKSPTEILREATTPTEILEQKKAEAAIKKDQADFEAGLNLQAHNQWRSNNFTIQLADELVKRRNLIQEVIDAASISKLAPDEAFHLAKLLSLQTQLTQILAYVNRNS